MRKPIEAYDIDLDSGGGAYPHKDGDWCPVLEVRELEQYAKELEEKLKVLWVFLKEQHTFRVEDDLNTLEMEESFDLLTMRVDKALQAIKL